MNIRQLLSRSPFIKRQWHRALKVVDALTWRMFLGRARSDQLSETVIRTLTEARDPRPTPGEKESLQQIEFLRKEMLASAEEVRFTNFGAITPGYQKAAEEEEAGVESCKNVSDICTTASQSPEQGFMLFRLMRNLKPVGCLELGTCLGISAMYIGTGLQQNGKGRLLTVEGGKALADIAAGNLERLGLDSVEVLHGRVEDRLEECLAKIGQVDFAFIDANHDGDATVRYFEEVSSHLGAGAVVLFDDIRWSRDMTAAWNALKSSPLATRTYDLGTKGVLAYHPGAGRQEHYRVALKRASIY